MENLMTTDVEANQILNDLSAKLEAYCLDNGLPYESADEVLLVLYEEENLREPQIEWIKQFIEEWERAAESLWPNNLPHQGTRQ
jgi:hypothetical protein